MSPAATVNPAPGWFTSMLLGLLQGATEFLPISSSGHLAAVQLLLPDIARPGVTLELAVHLGTTMAVCLYYRELLVLVLQPGNTQCSALGIDSRRWRSLLIWGFVPTGILGFAGQEFFRAAFESLDWVAVGLTLTGMILMLTRNRMPGSKDLDIPRVLMIGAAQGVALLPGLSRSGTTISLALLLGVSHRQAVTYSLLLSIPTVISAVLMDVYQSLGASDPLPLLSIDVTFATLSALAVGYPSIRIVHRATEAAWWHRFAWYCWPLAAIFALASG